MLNKSSGLILITCETRSIDTFLVCACNCILCKARDGLGIQIGPGETENYKLLLAKVSSSSPIFRQAQARKAHPAP